MKKYFLLFALLIFGFNVKSQVKLLSLNELDERVTKGSDTTYVVNFWATWCVPCVEELPSFEKLQADSLSKPLKVLLISLDFKSKLKTEVIPFVERHKLKTEVFVINEPDQQAFIERVDKNWSGAIPATLFINTKRNVRQFVEKAYASYDELIKQIETFK
jgi:thiol-disulfide isomerase/thioredoxin